MKGKRGRPRKGKLQIPESLIDLKRKNKLQAGMEKIVKTGMENMVDITKIARATATTREGRRNHTKAMKSVDPSVPKVWLFHNMLVAHAS